MPKSSKEQIVADEIKILNELRNNSKLSYSDLAEKTGFSRQKVWRIVNNLEKNNTIWGYKTVIDEEKLDLKQYIILIKRKGTVPGKELLDITINRVLRDQLEKMGIFVEASYYTHGSYDWITIISAKNIHDVFKFNEGIRRKYHSIIENIQVIEILFPLHKEGIENPKKNKLLEFF